MEYCRTEINYNGDELTVFGLFDSDHIFKHLNIVGNFYELKLLEKIKSLNLKGTYIDVGANIGNHTIYFSKFCDSDEVISIELNNEIYNVLKYNIDFLNLKNVTPINIGVGEKYKHVSVSDIDITNVGMTKIIDEDGDIVVNTLDDILSDVDNIKLIKFDVEGYETNALMGAKNIIKKHSPVIISELRDDIEFNQFEEIANELGYVTDKINYASTPTYFWYKSKKTYEYLYIIPTYERYDKIIPLIKNILDINKNTLIIVLNDGSNDKRYLNLKNTDDRIVYLENNKNNGKENYWITINTLLNEMSKYEFKYGVMLGDDFQLVDNYYDKLTSYLNKTEIIRLFTQSSVGDENWGYKNWIDGAFCAPYSFFNDINFELFPIQHRGKLLSSGVGLQMTKRLNNLNYVVKNYGSLIVHIGNEDSKMHPILRPSQPLITNFKSKEKILSVIISTYKNIDFFDECLNSILKSCRYFEVEILIGIDGCEKTLKHLENKVFSNNVRVFNFETNNGPYVVRNTLSNIASSDLILFFDSDDVMSESMINDILQLHKTKQVVKPSYVEFDLNLDKPKNEILYGEGVFSIEKKLLLSMNGFEPWKCGADSDFMKRLYKNNVRVGYTKKISFFRRVHSNSLTQSPETGMSSQLRHHYFKLNKQKTNFGPLEKLTIANYNEISVAYDKIGVNIDNRLDRNKLVDNLIDKLNIKKTKEPSNNIDYDFINKVMVKNGVYLPEKKEKPKKQFLPDDRNKLMEIKEQGHLTKELNKLFPKKPKRNNSLNIFKRN